MFIPVNELTSSLQCYKILSMWQRPNELPHITAIAIYHQYKYQLELNEVKHLYILKLYSHFSPDMWKFDKVNDIDELNVICIESWIPIFLFSIEWSCCNIFILFLYHFLLTWTVTYHTIYRFVYGLNYLLIYCDI
jgi:hypothetical protein